MDKACIYHFSSFNGYFSLKKLSLVHNVSSTYLYYAAYMQSEVAT